MFTSDDAPDWKKEVACSESWATSCLRKIITGESWRGISCRLDPYTIPLTGINVIRSILPRMSTENPWRDHPFLILPVFFDAIRHADPSDLRKVSTRRHFLEVGAQRARLLGNRRHTYYKTLEDVNNFIKALNALSAVPMRGDTSFDDCVSLIAQEITGDWMYLFDLSNQELGLVGRLEQLHRSLIVDPWRYSDTYALSNVVSVLALLGHFRVEGQEYSHCNLRNAQIINAAQIVRSQFHGVDLAGARILDATIVDGMFVGVDFTGASFERSLLQGKSIFVGCRFGKNTFDQATLNNAKSQPNVRFVESFPDGWVPEHEV
jgi:hypothetical protein